MVEIYFNQVSKKCIRQIVSLMCTIWYHGNQLISYFVLEGKSRKENFHRGRFTQNLKMLQSVIMRLHFNHLDKIPPVYLSS